jgi:hypothetical protein
MTHILLPEGTRPTNLHLREGDRARLVSNDLYHIAERIREISPNLYILELDQDSAEGRKFGLAIMEHSTDGVDRLVFRVALGDLDSRVLDRLRKLMSVDLHTRIAICDKEREKWEAEEHENSLEEAWEKMGGPMWVQLEKDGFIESRGVSYNKLNKTARRHGRRI